MRSVFLEAAIYLAATDENLAYFAWEEGKARELPTLFINCNDEFSPAADAEPVPWDQVPRVKWLYEYGGRDHVMAWVAEQRSRTCLRDTEQT